MAFLYSGRSLSHAYIIASSSAEQRRTEAERLAAAMLCQAAEERPCGVCRNCRKVFSHIHPDVITVERENAEKGGQKREIYVDQIRALVLDMQVLPNEAGKKVYVIQDAAAMNASAQNALLKGLEEPPEFVSFILCTDNAGGLLDTVRSRCVEINLQLPEEPQEQLPEAARAYIEAVVTGRPEKILAFCAENEGMDNAAALEFVAGVKSELVEVLCNRRHYTGLSREQAMGLIRLMDRAGNYLRANVGVKHVFGLLAVQTK